MVAPGDRARCRAVLTVSACVYLRPAVGSLEADADADDDRKGQPARIVVDVVEAGADELVDLRESADVAKADLRVEIELVGETEEHAGIDPPRERRGAIVEIGGGEHGVALRRRELRVDAADER